MERKILLLGLLRNHEMYGYQLNDLIDAHLGTSIQLTKPTAYRFLNQMAEDGWIVYRQEQEGKRPTRRVYSITPAGEQEFLRMLRESLGSFKPAEFRSTISLAFMHALPQEEILPLLQKQRTDIKNLLAENYSDEIHQGSFKWIIDLQKRHLKIDLEWLEELISGL